METQVGAPSFLVEDVCFGKAGGGSLCRRGWVKKFWICCRGGGRLVGVMMGKESGFADLYDEEAVMEGFK